MDVSPCTDVGFDSSHQKLDHFRAKLLNARTWDALKTTRVIVCGNEYTTLKLLGKVNLKMLQGDSGGLTPGLG